MILIPSSCVLWNVSVVARAKTDVVVVVDELASRCPLVAMFVVVVVVVVVVVPGMRHPFHPIP
jgi:hypothetical protein